MKTALGILGGLGPISSAEFVKTIYELNIDDSEQAAPACFLYSDPSFPKRSETIAAGQEDIFIDRLVLALTQLVASGSTKIVMCCMTIHHFLPLVPVELREKVISLVDIIADEILKQPQKYLLLSSFGTYDTKIFPNHHRWSEIAPHIVFLDEGDRHIVHNCFEVIKINGGVESTIDFIYRAREKYGVSAIVGACSELHVAHKYLLQQGDPRFDFPFVDPLMTIATNLPQLLDT